MREEIWYRVLWAPWRMAYIKDAVGSKGRECVFCVAQKRDAEESLVVHGSRRAFVIMNLYPYNTGHVMVVPRRHVPSLVDLDNDELSELMLLVKATIRGLTRALKPHGFNIGVNLGRIAGAGIADHVHIHIVPRWDGDTNFMVVTGGTKVIPQDVRETYRLIRKPIIEEARKLGL